jgi:hypothetical protein
MSQDPTADRAFLRDVLGFDRYVEDAGTGPGWLIFKLPPAYIRTWVTDRPSGGVSCATTSRRPWPSWPPKAVEFTAPVSDAGLGLVTMLRPPGGGQPQLYQPKHAVAVPRGDLPRANGRCRHADGTPDHRAQLIVAATTAELA